VKKGKVISLVAQLRPANGPRGAKSKYPDGPDQTRFTDAAHRHRPYSGGARPPRHPRADDICHAACSAARKWEAWATFILRNSMWNGYDCREVTSNGAQKMRIEKTKTHGRTRRVP